ncbi:MAG: hypothetical protein ACREP7_09420 [Lysobacter sp.]
MNKPILALGLACCLTSCLSVVPYTSMQAYEGASLPLQEVARVVPLLQGNAGGRLNLYTVDGKNIKNPKTGLPPSEVQLLPGKHSIGGAVHYSGCSSAMTVDLDAKKGSVYYLSFLNEQYNSPTLLVKEENGGRVSELSRKTLDTVCTTIYLKI